MALDQLRLSVHIPESLHYALCKSQSLTRGKLYVFYTIEIDVQMCQGGLTTTTASDSLMSTIDFHHLQNIHLR
ncbi:MAG TPA: hypothetical protein VEZ17_00055 [Chitinophagaceae bacterium]|nr:hypothetical protein [Chitinophagaceae bacterium]